MANIDIFTYNGEADLLELRLNILNNYVDQFIIIEAPTTFSGLPKPLYYLQNKQRFSRFHAKIYYFVIDENYDADEHHLAQFSPNTVGAAHWKHEFLQKESIKKALLHLNPKDTCYIGDVDEIWNPELQYPPIAKLRLLVYPYYLNNLSDEVFYGTLKAPYEYVYKHVLNHLRSRTDIQLDQLSGWHFTSQGGLKEVRRKLNDSYTTESYNTLEVQQNLSDRMAQNKDYLGRPFTFITDETLWPQYLKDNKADYHSLLLPMK